MSTARPSRRSQGDSRIEARTVPGLHGYALQLSGLTQRLPGWRSRSQEGHGHCQRPHPREARPQLGRTILDHVMAKEGNLQPGDVRWIEAATFMEYRALTEVLPIMKMTQRTTPPFIYSSPKKILVILLNFIIYFSFYDITFFPFKPKGQDCFSF